MSQTWLLAGDSHGDKQYLRSVFVLAHESGVDRIVQLGDHGFGWDKRQYSGTDGRLVCELIRWEEKQVSTHGVPLYWIDGNHDNFDLLADTLARLDPELDGTYQLRDGVFYVPRGTLLDVGSQRILFCGGAVSIDKHWRLMHERRGGARQWWPQEAITDDDVERCAKQGPADILMTHDFPWEVHQVDYHLTPIVDPALRQSTQKNRERVSRILQACGAKQVYHGHLHEDYTERILGDVRVRGLGCNGQPLTNTCALLDLS